MLSEAISRYPAGGSAPGEATDGAGLSGSAARNPPITRATAAIARIAIRQRARNENAASDKRLPRNGSALLTAFIVIAGAATQSRCGTGQETGGDAWMHVRRTATNFRSTGCRT